MPCDLGGSGVVSTALAIIGLCVGGAQPAFAAPLPPSLGGDPTELVGNPVVEAEVDCNPEGISTIRFTVEGVAIGYEHGYTGTFTESGVYTFGPIVKEFEGRLYGEVLTFESDFRIDSPVGTVTGHKTFNPDAYEQYGGFCGRADDPDAFHVVGSLYFDAVIETAEGVYTESGGAHFAHYSYSGVERFQESHITHGGPVPVLPTSSEQCEGGDWATYGVFKNHGDCVSFVATKGKNPPAGQA